MLYKIARHKIEIDYDAEQLHEIMPNLTPFETEEEGKDDVLMTMHIRSINEGLHPTERCRLIRDVDTGNGKIKVDRMLGEDGNEDIGYQFLIRDIYGKECGLLQTDKRFRECSINIQGEPETIHFALNNALMLSFAFSSAYHDTLLIHASVVRHQPVAGVSGSKIQVPGLAYAFTAKSGTGKSTQVSNWLNNIEGCDLVNDDNPVIRITDGKPMLYGSPWSGKTPCYRNIEVPLGAILLIARDDHNHVTPQEPLKSFDMLLTACSAMKWDEELYSHLCDTVIKFVESGIKMATLHCLPDAESAKVCRAYLEG